MQGMAIRVRRSGLCFLGLLVLSGCGGPHALPEVVWGQHGTQPGDLVRPRAIAIDAQDRVFIVDFTARIQVFDRDGHFIGPCWFTPIHGEDGASGLSIDRDGNLLVSDTHYHCLRIFSADGKELRTIAKEPGSKPGQLAFVNDTVQDADGYFYIGEDGENCRITKLDKDGNFIKCWGSEGSEPGQFGRIRSLVLGPDNNLYICDALNHRIEVFTRDGQLVDCWGQPGSEPGQLSYPHDLAFGPHGELYVAERGNNRVQKFTRQGVSLGCWGGPGREPGRLHEPWALAVDSHGRVHIVDTENHRVQRIEF
jgi:DNA-binding beta-propeller fold protein YncE